MKRTTLFLITLLLLLTTCKKERAWENPYDSSSQLDPNAWAPTNLTLQDVTITSRKLTWSYSGTTNFEGFRIDRKDGDNPWQEAHVTLTKDKKEWTDEEIVPDLSRSYQYKIYSFAGDNLSASATANTTGAIAAPSNISVTINSINSLTLNWQDNSNGEDGFKIDRRTNEGEWQQAFATINANQTSYTDNGVNLTNSYTYRVYAYAGSFTSAFAEKQVLPPLPTVSTKAVTGITTTTAVSGGDVTSIGGFSVITRGVCWSTSQNPTVSNAHTTDGQGTGTYTSNLTILIPNTTYYVRAYATNSVGTGYGNQVSFTTLAADGTTGTVSYNSYTYKTVYINGMEWFAENLRTTKYNDGTSIPLVTDNAAWVALSTPAYCWYSNDQTTYGNTYGALYNWYAVSTTTNGGKNVCPTGWHVPTDAEWYAMENYVDPTINNPSATGWRGTDGGTKLKATSGWNSGGNGTDIYGFSALPGGYRNDGLGTFSAVGYDGHWWSSTELDASLAWDRHLHYVYGSVYRYYYNKRYGFSVRCVR
nr:FISUMP domain-containing protein [Tenuifilaceae bacterium]